MSLSVLKIIIGVTLLLAYVSWHPLRRTYACWMLSAGANPAFIANQMGHENAEMVFHVYSAWINALDGDQVSFLSQRFGGYTNDPIVPLKIKTK